MSELTQTSLRLSEETLQSLKTLKQIRGLPMSKILEGLVKQEIERIQNLIKRAERI